MTTRRIYSCNFCRQDMPKEDIMGIEWQVSGQKLRWLTPAQCENHLCKTCEDALRQLLQEPR